MTDWITFTSSNGLLFRVLNPSFTMHDGHHSINGHPVCVAEFERVAELMEGGLNAKPEPFRVTGDGWYRTRGGDAVKVLLPVGYEDYVFPVIMGDLNVSLMVMVVPI